MTPPSNNLLIADAASEPGDKHLISRDSVIESIVRLNADEASSVVGDQEHQLRRLIQTLRNRKGGFALIFVVCNEAPLRQQITQQIKDKLPDQRPVELVLNEKEESVLDQLLDAPGAPEPLFVYGLEEMLPTSEAQKLRRETTLQELQLRREQFRRVNRPLLLWMPEYAYTLIGQQAVDFWSWQGGAFFFTEIQRRKAEVSAEQEEIITEIQHLKAEVSVVQEEITSRLSATEAAGPFAAWRHQLPSPPRDFIGRQAELNNLKELILGNGVGCVALQGLGGAGKTALGLKLADDLRAHYPDAQIFLDLKGTHGSRRGEGALTPAEAMWHVIGSLQPAARRPGAEAELQDWYLSVLRGQRAILFFDNAGDADQLRPLLPPAGCLMITTSRRRFVLPGTYHLDLEMMSPEDAEVLLLSIAPRIGREAGAIARLCNYLPLALRFAASLLEQNPSLSSADLLRRLGGRSGRLEMIEASLSLSYEYLTEELRRLWRALAVFPESFDAVAAASVWGTDVDPAQEKLAELKSHSLVEFNKSAVRFRLHDLARDFADARLSDDERTTAQHRHAIYYQQLLSAADDLYLKGGDAIAQGLLLFDREWGNIQAGQSWAASRADRDDEAAWLCIAYPDAGVYVLDLRQHSRERIRWLETAVSAAQRLKQRGSEGNHLGNLGLSYAHLGEPRKAIEHYEQALAVSREIGDRRNEGNQLGNLGNAYARLGELRKAIEHYEQALAVSREIGDRRNDGNALGNLGNAYAALGEPRKAIEHHEQALAISREIGDRRGEGSDLGNLGLSYADLGEPRKAIELMEAAVKIFEEIESPNAAVARQWLAKLRGE